MGIYKIISEEAKRLFSDSFYDEQEASDVGDYQYRNTQKIMEVGEGGHEPYPWRQTRQDKHNYDYEFQTEDGDDYEVVVMDVGNFWNVDFKTKTGHFEDVLNKGRFFGVMATVGAAVQDFLIKEQPEVVRISPAKNSNADQRRLNIYMQLLQKQLPPNYEASTSGGYIYVQKAEELANVAEGTGDKYAEKQFGIKDTNQDYMQQTHRAVHDPDMGELIGYASRYLGNGKRSPIKDYPIYKNPKNLSKFGSNVRALSDADGNLFVGLVSGDYLHGQMQQQGMAYELDWGLTWQRVGDTNKFGLSDSSAGYPYVPNEIKRKKFSKHLDAVQRVNPQFEFYKEYYYDLTEGVGDKYAEKQWGIPDQDKKYQDMGVPDADMGEKMVEIWASSFGGEKENHGWIYKNPQTLKGFDNDVRAIGMINGDLYVAQGDGYFIHTDMELSLEKKIGRLDDYIEFHRVGNTNTFGASDTLREKIDNMGFWAGEFFNALIAKHPQFKFYSNYYQELREGIQEVEDNSDHRPDEMPYFVGETINEEAQALVEGYSSYQEKQEWEAKYQEHLKARSQTTENGTLVKRLVDDNQEVINIYQNPKSLRNFGKGVRAISVADGNLFVGQFDKEYLHADMAEALGIPRDDYIAWHRMMETNKFNSVDTGVHGDAQEYIQAVQQLNPGFEFHVMDISQYQP